MLVDHLARIHAVDVVGAEHADRVRALVVDEVQVLVDRVGRAREPAWPAAHLRGHGRDVVAHQRRQMPGRRDVPVEAVALVLRQNDDPAEARVDEIREREVDQPVVAAEGHRRLRPVGGQRREPLALTARQDDGEDARRSHRPTLNGCRWLRLPLLVIARRRGRARLSCRGRGLRSHPRRTGRTVR